MANYLFLFLLLLISNVSLAQQQEQAVDSKKQQQESEQAPEKNEKDSTTPTPISAQIKQPVSQVKLYESDLTHYLPQDMVKNVLIGPDSHISLVKPHNAANQKGVMILLPEWQQPAMSPQAINFLQQALPEQGWVVITPQPIEKPINFPSTATELTTQAEENKTALENYRKTLKPLLMAVMEKAQNYPGIIVFVAQGHNAMFASELFAQNDIPQPQALVLLSAQMSTQQTMELSAEKLASLELPVLDLFLRVDSPVVHHHAKLRQKHVYYLAKSQYRQKQLHNIYAGYYQGEPLVKEINGWLRSIGW